MAGPIFRFPVHPGWLLVVVASLMSAAHAASLNGISGGTLDAWVQPTTVVAVCDNDFPDVPCVVPEWMTFDGHLKNNVSVLVLGTVTKKVKMKGGTVTVGSTGVVLDNVTQGGPGDIILDPGSFVDGKVTESGAGSVVANGDVTDGVTESGPGDLTVGPGATVGKDVKESGDGSLVVNGFVGGDAEEKDDGDMTVGSGAWIGADADSRPLGVCVIDPAATVVGTRKNLCALP